MVFEEKLHGVYAETPRCLFQFERLSREVQKNDLFAAKTREDRKFRQL